MSDHEHWQSIYTSKDSTEVSWFRQHLQTSLDLIEQSGKPLSARVVDVGGGASTLVDDLRARGYTNLAVLDLSAAALASSRARMGTAAEEVDWVTGDVTTPMFAAESVDLWHDRAVFHFLTDPGARAAYIQQVVRSTVVGAHVLIATFAPDGPERCSGLPVRRYDANGIVSEFGAGFTLDASASEAHETPWGSHQAFTYALLRRQS